MREEKGGEPKRRGEREEEEDGRWGEEGRDENWDRRVERVEEQRRCE